MRSVRMVQNKTKRVRDVALALLVSYTLAFSMLFPFNVVAFQAFANEPHNTALADAALDEVAKHNESLSADTGTESDELSEDSNSQQADNNDSGGDEGLNNSSDATQDPDSGSNDSPDGGNDNNNGSQEGGNTTDSGDNSGEGNGEGDSTNPEDNSKDNDTDSKDPTDPNADKPKDSDDPDDKSDPDNPNKDDKKTFQISYVVNPARLQTDDGTELVGIPANGGAPGAETLQAGSSFTPTALTSYQKTFDDAADSLNGTWYFKGWYVDTALSNPAGTLNVDADIVLYGQWQFIPANEPHLVITIELDDDEPDLAFEPGEKIRYIITVENDGAATAENVKFEGNLPGFMFDIYKKEFDRKSVAYMLVNDEGNELKNEDNPEVNAAYGPLALAASINAGQHVTLRGEYSVTQNDAKAGNVVVQVAAITAEKNTVYKSDAFRVKTQSSASEGKDDKTADADKKDEDQPNIEQFNVAWREPGSTAAAQTSSPTISTKGKQVQLEVLLLWSNGRETYASKLDPAMNITWTSSDEKVATVDEQGLVTPQGKNGLVVITANGTTERNNSKDCPFNGTLAIQFYNQQDDAVLSVFYHDNKEIPVDGKGSTLIFEDRGQEYSKRIYATFEYRGKTYSSKDAMSAAEDGISFEFIIENEEIAKAVYSGGGMTWVWPDKKATKNSTALYVLVFTENNTYTRMIPLNIDGDIDWDKSGGIVPNELTISVSWEMDPNPSNPKTVEYVYSLAQLDQRSTLRQAYTMIRSPGSSWEYAYQTARGVKLVDLFNDCEIFEDDVYAIEVKATDNNTVTTAFMSVAQFFNEPRYYYPNYYMDANTAGAIPAFAMIAVASNVYKSTWDSAGKRKMATTKATRVDNLYSANAELDNPDATQPRLCIGAFGTQATGGAYSIKNVERIHVVLRGAPPADPLPEEDDSDPEEEIPGNGDGSGDGNGSGTGVNGDAGSGAGSKEAGSGSNATKGNEGAGSQGDNAQEGKETGTKTQTDDRDVDDGKTSAQESAEGGKKDTSGKDAARKPDDKKNAGDTANNNTPRPNPQPSEGDMSIQEPDKEAKSDLPEDQEQTKNADPQEETAQEPSENGEDQQDESNDDGTDAAGVGAIKGNDGNNRNSKQDEDTDASRGVEEGVNTGALQDIADGLAGAGSGAKGNTSYSVFQMISNARTLAPITILENPWAPYVLLIIDIIVLAGATRFAVWYALQKKNPKRMIGAPA